MKVLMLLNNYGILKVSDIVEKMGVFLFNIIGLFDCFEKLGFVKCLYFEEDCCLVVV